MNTPIPEAVASVHFTATLCVYRETTPSQNQITLYKMPGGTGGGGRGGGGEEEGEGCMFGGQVVSPFWNAKGRFVNPLEEEPPGPCLGNSNLSVSRRGSRTSR